MRERRVQIMPRADSAGFCGSVTGDALPRHAQMLSKLVGGKNLIWTRMRRNEMALTRDFREIVQARVRRDPAFRKGLLRDAIESLLAGEVALGKEVLRDYINATVGFPELAEHTKLHVETLHQMF